MTYNVMCYAVMDPAQKRITIYFELNDINKAHIYAYTSNTTNMAYHYWVEEAAPR